MLRIVPPVVWIGSMSGPNGIALALLGLLIVLFVPEWLILVRPLCHANLLEYSVTLFRPFGMALAATIPVWTLADLVDSAMYRLIIGLSIATATYVIFAYSLNRN